MAYDVSVGLKNAAFRSGLEQMRGQARRFSLDLKGMVGGIAGSFAGVFSVAGIAAFADKMREIKREALRFGTSAEDVQRMGKAARLADVDFNTLAKGLNHVTLEAGRAARGGQAQGQMFKTLGIDAARFATLPMPERLAVLAGAFEASRGSGEKTAAMLELLGTRGQEMIPLLAQGGDAIKKTMSEAEVQTNKTVESFARLSRMIEKVKGIGAREGGKFLPGLVNHVIGYAQAAKADAGGIVDDARSGKTGGFATAMHIAALANPFSAVARNYRAYQNAQKMNAADDAAAAQPTAAAPGNDFEAGGAIFEKKKKLLREIADQAEKDRVEEMEGSHKINALIEARDAKLREVNQTTEEGLEAWKHVAELNGQITAAEKERARALAGAQRNRARELEGEYLRIATPKEQAALLREKQRATRREAQSFRDRGLEDKAIEKGTEADKIDGELLKLRGLAPRVAVGSLQRVGGGGGSFQGDLVARQNDRKIALLQQIRDALAGEEKAVAATPRDF